MKLLIEDLSLLFQGIRVLHKLSPWNLAAKMLRSLCDAALPFANLYLTAMIIDSLINRADVSEILILVALTLAVNLILMLVSQLMDTVNYVKWSQFYLRYNMSIGEKALSLEYSKIEDPATHVMIKNIDDAMKISNYGLIKLHSRIPLFVENFFKVVFSVSLTVSVIFQKGINAETAFQNFVNSPIADILLIAIIIIAAAGCIFANTKIAAESYNLLGLLSKLNRVFDYYLNNYLDSHRAGKDIRLYRQDLLIDDEINRFGDKSGAIVKNLNKVIFSNNFLVTVFNFALTFYTYLYVGVKSMTGAFNIGDILKYSGGILQFSSAFSGMMDAFSQLRSNSKYLKNYFRYMNLPSCSFEGTLPVTNKSGQRHVIEFRNVSFRYPGAKEFTLKNLNLTFGASEKIAIVGRNGCGKTTMIKLLCRLYEPTEGVITLDNVDIREYDISQYMSIFGVVFQDFKLFSFTLGQNVAAKTDYDSEKVLNVLISAGISGRLKSMPDGLDTVLYKDFSDSGIEVSGGEAQKIALARALYKDAPFIVLDEPTAALDPIAEFEIYSRFNEIVGDQTVIYISHRLSSCRFCDNILVFNDGQLAQSGKHDTLLEDSNGVYNELWNAQSQYYNDTDV